VSYKETELRSHVRFTAASSLQQAGILYSFAAPRRVGIHNAFLQ